MFVSVIMAVHNGEKYVQDAVNSVLNQTHRALELMIVDDASTDSTGQLLNQITDNRVKVTRFYKNQGAAFALNTAVNRAKGKWIAVHDADDISFPQRIEEQVRFIKQKPELVLVGSFIECFTVQADPVSTAELHWLEYRRNAVQTSEVIRQGLYSGCPLTHGAVMFSRRAFKEAGGYNPDLRIAYDYDLFTRLIAVGPMENVPKILYKYRRHHESLSASKNLQNTSRELFYSFSRFVRSSCYEHLDRPPVILVFGPRSGTEAFAQQSESIFTVIPVYRFNKRMMEQVAGYIQEGIPDGAVILDNLAYGNYILGRLIKRGFILNKNLFRIWSRI